jgi:hypothetical protein
MNIGQAAGMAAALCIEFNCQPQQLPVRKLQSALLQDSHAPSAIIPLFNLPPQHPDWLYWQTYYLDSPEAYPLDGNCPVTTTINNNNAIDSLKIYRGSFQRYGFQDYGITLSGENKTWQLITIYPEVDRQLLDYSSTDITVIGNKNRSLNSLTIELIGT